MRAQLEAAEGAVLIVKAVGFPQDELKPAVGAGFGVTIMNIGKASATQVTPLTHRWTFARFNDKPAFEGPDESLHREVVLEPGEEWNILVDIPPEALTSDLVGKFNNREPEFLLYVYGHIRYHNGFSIKRLRFCYTYLPPARRGAFGPGTLKKSEHRTGGCEYIPP